MNQQDPKKIPFTEEPEEKELTSYATFKKASRTCKICDHFKHDGTFYSVDDETSNDKKVREANKVKVLEKKVEHDEGLIERKDVYAFIEDLLKREGRNMRCYWAIQVKDTLKSGLSPMPVFQFGTLGLEILARKAGTIQLGTWDVEIMLKACKEYEAGKKIMNKVSGKAISEGGVEFRWYLRGPKIDRGLQAGPMPRRLIKKCTSLFKKASGKDVKANGAEEDG